MVGQEDVFISLHEESSLPIARQIANQLKVRNISCWFAKGNITSGQNWMEEIVKHSESCKLFLLILNKEATVSVHVETEVRIAHDRYSKKRDILIKPVQVDNDDLSNSAWVTYYLGGFQIEKLLAQKDSSGVYILDEADVSKLAQEIALDIDPSGLGSVIKEGTYTPEGENSPLKYTLYKSGMVKIVQTSEQGEEQTINITTTIEAFIKNEWITAKRREKFNEQVAEFKRVGIAHSKLDNVNHILDIHDQRVLDLRYKIKDEPLRRVGKIIESYANLEVLHISEATKRAIGEQIVDEFIAAISD